MPPLRRAIKPVLLRLGKPTLSEEIVAGITWRAVRDALKMLARMPYGEFDGEEIGLVIFRERIVAESRRDVRPTGPWFGSLSSIRELEHVTEREPIEEWRRGRAIRAIRKARKEGERLCRRLARTGLLDA